MKRRDLLKTLGLGAVASVLPASVFSRTPVLGVSERVVNPALPLVRIQENKILTPEAVLEIYKRTGTLIKTVYWEDGDPYTVAYRMDGASDEFVIAEFIGDKN